jgi:hypothetical protein
MALVPWHSSSRISFLKHKGRGQPAADPFIGLDTRSFPGRHDAEQEDEFRTGYLPRGPVSKKHTFWEMIWGRRDPGDFARSSRPMSNQLKLEADMGSFRERFARSSAAEIKWIGLVLLVGVITLPAVSAASPEP